MLIRFCGITLSASLLMATGAFAREPLQFDQPSDPRTLGAKYATSEPGDFAWQLFLYVNWPADPAANGAPDPQGTLSSTAATVWETWKNVAQIFLPDGQKPAPWQDDQELPANAGATPPDLTSLGPVDSDRIQFLSESAMIDGQQIVDGDSQIIRYEVKDNQPQFDYVVNNPAGYALYNLAGQEQARDDPNFKFDFPADAMEVKASWRILQVLGEPPQAGVDESRYHTAYAAFIDQNQQLRYAKVGLTGLHITSKLLPKWFWITFQQVDDANDTFNYFLQEKGKPVGPPVTLMPAAEVLNKEYQAALQGTKWQYYELIGWQYDFVDSQGQPTVLANTQIETYFQKLSSCASCHAMANIGPLDQRRLAMWQSGRSGLRGRIGPIDFQAIAKDEDPGRFFKQMDFVWSLRQARPVK